MASPSRSGSFFVAVACVALSGAVLAGDGLSPGGGTPARTESVVTCPSPGVSAAGAGPVDLRVGLEEVDRLLRAGRVIVVDVREEEAYERAHLPGAISIPLDQLGDCVANLKFSGVSVVTYCASATCDRGAAAALALRRLGVPEVRALDGGFPGWVESGRVVVVPPTL